MIHDVDESLRTLVRREALNGSRVEIGFDAPTREWSARQNTPTVSLYLYDIREDLQRRERLVLAKRRALDGIEKIQRHHLHPQFLQFSEDCRNPFHIVHDEALDDLDLQVLRLQAGILQHSGDSSGEVLLPELAG